MNDYSGQVWQAMQPALALSETAQTWLIIGGFIVAVIVMFVLSLIFWLYALKLVFWRWWTGVLVIGGVIALFITKVVTFPGIYGFFRDGWHNPLVLGLALLVFAAPVGMIMLFLGGSGGSSHSTGYGGVCPGCSGQGMPTGCVRCGAVS